MRIDHYLTRSEKNARNREKKQERRRELGWKVKEGNEQESRMAFEKIIRVERINNPEDAKRLCGIPEELFKKMWAEHYRLKEICGFNLRDKGSQETCRYLTFTEKGFKCSKKNDETRRIIDQKFAREEIKSQGDNCEGIDPDIVIQTRS